MLIVSVFLIQSAGDFTKENLCKQQINAIRLTNIIKSNRCPVQCFSALRTDNLLSQSINYKQNAKHAKFFHEFLDH